MDVCEIFYSIQGEGILIGLPTVFLRTSGCNLRCTWCDTKYAYEKGIEYSIDELVDELHGFPSKRLCITGGEPMLQDDLIELIDELQGQFDISVETNGSLDILPLVERDIMVSMDYKTPSSDMTDKMLEEDLKKLRERDQLKFVINDEVDYEFAKKVLENADVQSEIVLQPTAGTTEDVSYSSYGPDKLKRIAAWVMRDALDVRILPQLHKVIWGGERGR
ncbi:MAG: radical SAM protein [Thermoplasmata archaeon]